MARAPFDKNKLMKYGLFLIATMALTAILISLALDSLPGFGFDG